MSRYHFLTVAALLAACSAPEPVRKDTPPLPPAARPAAARPLVPTPPQAPVSQIPPAPPPVVTPSIEAYAPNPNLYIEGIPPVPRSLANDIAKYTEFRGHVFVDWHPTKREMLVTHRDAGAQTTQLFRIASPMAEPEQLTDFPDPVRSASYEPRQGRYIVLERDTGGNESNQLYRLDLPSKQLTLLTEPEQKHTAERWLHRTGTLLVSSVPLDKTAPGGTRGEVTQTLRLVDPAQPGVSRRIAELPGTGWSVGAVSWDDRQAALIRYVSANESEVWLLNLATGKTTQVLPKPGTMDKAIHFAGAFSRDDGGLFVISDRDGEFRELMFYRLATKRLQSLSAATPWDVSDLSVSDGARLVTARVNADGRGELRWYDALSLKELANPPSLPPGSVRGARFHRKLPEVALTVDSSKSPGRVVSVNPNTRAVEAWTQPFFPAGIEASSFAEPENIRFPSFDGRVISAIVHRPPARFAGRRPVLISIHGGPESQARVGFAGRMGYLVHELGITLIEPNVRGSSGYGKTFLTLDNGVLREDAVRDIGGLLDWISTQPDLDASKVVVSGGSYGGYMSLAASARYADRIAGAIDVVGISNFVTFLTRTESYRRDLRRVEYGDERDPQMRSFLEEISPTRHADRIKKPLFVVHGRNDPRVPHTEAEQIVARARAGGNARVWYLRAENEGHGFARKENVDYQFFASVLFVRSVLIE